MTTQLIPKLKEKTSEYKEWWIFKPNSPLSAYISKNGYMFTLYFRPTELIQALKSIASYKDMYAHGNNDVIILDEELQECFNTTSIYLPKLFSFCLCHVNIVNSNKCNQLKNELIKKELYINPPVNIILNDPTSKFWIPPQFVSAYNEQKKKNSYPWKELTRVFFKHISKIENGVTPLNNSMFQILSNCAFADNLSFTFFHADQVPVILKQITKFLGKSNTILTLCSDLHFCDISLHDTVIFWIEEMITKNYDAMPTQSSYVYL
jgi:hypothetical protein